MTMWKDPLKNIPQEEYPLTVTELSEKLAPLYQQYEANIRASISGITKYASILAASGQESQLPGLRKLVIKMAEFWPPEQMDKREYMRIGETNGAKYDEAITAARESGFAQELSDQEKNEILSGLQIHRCEMEYAGGMEESVSRCSRMEDELRSVWLSEPTMTEYGGMTLG